MSDAYFVHETAQVDPPVDIGERTSIWHFCHIMPGARIGVGCNIGQNVYVDRDVQIGNGRLNYINGYVSKDHDAVDVGLGEYVQKESTSSWLAAYRLLSKSSPCLPEVAIRMAQLSSLRC